MPRAAKKSTGKPMTGPEILTKMQDTVTLDRFYDRNPHRGDQTIYIRQVVERNRRDRALFIAKGDSKK